MFLSIILRSVKGDPSHGWIRLNRQFFPVWIWFLLVQLCMTTHRSVGKKKSLIYTDHFSLQLMFENIPLKPRQKCATLKETVWNTNKPGGWDKYKDLTEADDDLNSLAEGGLSNSTEYNHKMDKIMDKFKFK